MKLRGTPSSFEPVMFREFDLNSVGLRTLALRLIPNGSTVPRFFKCCSITPLTKSAESVLQWLYDTILAFLRKF